jgi:hypothetical protein
VFTKFELKISTNSMHVKTFKYLRYKSILITSSISLCISTSIIDSPGEIGAVLTICGHVHVDEA